MAEGFSLSVDNSLLKNLEKADKLINQIADSSQKMSKTVIESFKDANNNALKPFIENLNSVRKALDKKAQPIIFKEINIQASQAADKINSFISLMNKINNADSNKTRNSAVVKINQELEDAKKRLVELQNLLNFYAKGEGRKAIGFVDTTSAQQEARALMNRIDLLEREKASIQANARLRMTIAQQQQQRDNAWYQMENERRNIIQSNAKLDSDSAKASSQAYKKSYDERYKAYEEMFKAIERRESQLQSQMRKKTYQRTQQYGDTSGQAIASLNRMLSDKGLQSLNYMNQTLQKLQQAQSKVNLKTQDGLKQYDELNKRIQYLQRNINATTNSINNMGRAHRGLMDTAGQLARKLALVFSVSAIQGYMSKLIQIRGEFELQQKSLQVLLQNKDEADKLWQQTIDLAIKSPFRVSELVSYTRQLAAYRIENEKLHDTTKRLADVSAGLGVDMQRLILAFGQVRAANYLRGTELRQFTEAGIPMLDELAKYFSELEGRMVSAGDVFERISKRMVTFGDVEEVFHRLTDAGGTFYNMQEEQSKTLKGMISNLHDSIDLMLNDIGKSQDGLLKGSVNTVRSFVENWREVSFTLAGIIPLLASYKLGIAAYHIGTQKAATTTLWWNKALKANIGTSMVNIQTLKLSEAALVGVTKKQWLMGKATLYLQGALKGAGLAFTKFILPLVAIGGIVELVRVLTKASREAAALQKELNEIYNEDTKNLEKQADTFNDLVERLKTVNIGSKEHKDIISQLNSQYGEYLGFLVTEKTTYDELATSIDSVVMALTQKAKANTFEKALSKIVESVSKDMQDAKELITKQITSFGLVRASGGVKIIPTEKEINDIFGLIEKKTKETNQAITSNELDKILDSYYGQDVIRPGGVNIQNFINYSNDILKIKKEEEKLQSKINGMYGVGVYSTVEMRNKMEALNKEEEQALANEKTRIGQEKIRYDYLVKRTRLEGKYQGLDQSAIDANVAKLQKTSATIQDINRRIIEATDELGAEAVNRVYITAQDASQGTNAIAESMAAAYKSQQEEIKNQNALKEAGTVHDEKSLQNAEMMSKAYYKVLEIMGRLDLLESKGNKKESSLKILNNRINLVKEINKEYEKLNEKFSATAAKEKIIASYKDTFKAAFEGTGITFSGLVIDKEKLKEEGEKSGQVFSEEMVKKMNDVIESGTYIRSASDKFKDELKKDEGVVFQLYDDSTKKIINNTKDFQNAVGTVTIGWGHAIKDINEAAKYFGKTISEIEAQEIFDQDVDKHVQALNKVLNKYQDLILTQEQYDSLLNATFQGGGGMISSAISYAMDIDKGVKHFENLDIKLKKVGKTFEQEFGSDFISRFKNAETATERLALALETVGLTTVASGSNIDERLYNGMKKRSLERAKEFRGDLELVKLLHKAAVDVSQIDFTNIRGVIATLKELEPIAKKEGEEAELQLSKAISKLEAEVNLSLKVKEDKQLIYQIEEMFSGYELSLELQKMNIPPDLAKQLFNIDALTLPELRQQVISELSKGAEEGSSIVQQELNKSIADVDWDLITAWLGEDQMKKAKETLTKVSEMEEKEQEERLKKYAKYLVKAQSERIKAKVEEMRQIQEIENTFKMTEGVATERFGMDSTQWKQYQNLKEINKEELKRIGLNNKQIEQILEYNEQMRVSAQLAKEGVKKETQEKVDKAVWEEFKGSAMYEQLFGDLENLGTKSIDVLMDRLEKMKEALKQLPPEVYKEIQTQLDKLGELKMERNPFSEFKKAFEEIEELQKKRITYTNDEGKEITLKGEDAIVYEMQLEQEKAEKIREQLTLYQQIYKANGDINKLTEVGVSLTDEQKELLGDNKAINDKILELQGDLAKAEDEAKKKGQDVQKYKKARESLTKVQEATTAWGDAISGVLGGMDEILDAFGVAEDDSSRLWIQGAQQIANMIVQVVLLSAALKAMGVAANAALGVIGWIATALTAVATIFASIFAAGDKKKERKIQREIEYVEKLEKSYKRLEKAIDNAYSINTLQTSNKEAQRNLKNQIDAYDRMIKAEEAKKKTDKDRIKEWKNTQDELREQMQELREEVVSTATDGILDKVLDAAQAFTDAWYEAFKETGDGLSGLEENFAEMMQNLVKRQASMLITQQWVNKWKSELTKYINPDDLTLTANEAGKWVDEIKKSLPQLSGALENYFKAMEQAGVDLMSGSLSGLQKGIQGITEQQADILAAYLNSIRFFVSDNNNYLSQIAASFGNTEMENPMVEQLRIIASQTSAINTLLQSLVKGGHSLGGVGMKVFIS